MRQIAGMKCIVDISNRSNRPTTKFCEDLFRQLNNFARFLLFHTPNGCLNHIPTSKTVTTTKNMLKRHKDFAKAQQIAKYK